jgi:two-component system LytT family response regulator
LNSIPLDLEIIEASTGRIALEKIQQYPIDLFFIDIQLPDMSGLRIAEEIRALPQFQLTYMVFITTHVYYQLQAFKKFHCYDFIEKPYKSKDMYQLTFRLLQGIHRKEKEENESISFELKNCFIKIKVEDILFIESQKRNFLVHTLNQVYQITNYTTKQIIEIINKDYVMQTHKSFIINLNNIHRVEKSDRNAWSVYFLNYDQIAFVSNTYKEEFMSRITKK